MRRLILWIAVALVFILPLGAEATSGALSPEDALKVLETTKDAVIIEVNVDKVEVPFIGALWIPYTEIDTRCNEVPYGCPIVLHCRRGIAAKMAYDKLVKVRPDIAHLYYIAGVPPIEEYNLWYKSQAR